ncbi:MAG: OmpH family outer membrane protein [Flavicella sp.]
MYRLILVSLLCLSVSLSAQKAQKIAFVDMEYILQNVPEYMDAQKKLDGKTLEWKNKIKRSEEEIQKMETDLNNEKILLTENLISERKEEIDLKREELNNLEASFFGVNGKLFEMRKKFVQPVQDEIFNAIQEVVKKSKYDFVFERSSQLMLLHANPRYDISKTIIAYLTKTKKQRDAEAAKEKKRATREALEKRIEEQRKRREESRKKTIQR